MKFLSINVHPVWCSQKPLRRRLEGNADLQNVLAHNPLRLHLVRFDIKCITVEPKRAMRIASASCAAVSDSNRQSLCTPVAGHDCARSKPSTVLPFLQAPPPAPAAAPPQQSAVPPQRRPRETVLAYDSAALNQPGSRSAEGDSNTSGAGEEVCFEELRAAHMQRMRAAAVGAAADRTADAPPAAEQSPQPSHHQQQQMEEPALQPQQPPAALPSPQQQQEAALRQGAAAALAATSVPAIDGLRSAAAMQPAGPASPASRGHGPSSRLATANKAPQPAAEAAPMATADAARARAAAGAATPLPEPPLADPSRDAASKRHPLMVSAFAATPVQHPAMADASNAEDLLPAAPASGKRKRGSGLALRPTPQQNSSPVLRQSPEPAAAATLPGGGGSGDDNMDDIFAGAFAGPVLDQVGSYKVNYQLALCPKRLQGFICSVHWPLSRHVDACKRLTWSAMFMT